MDFHSLSRKELQILCKKNKIPANMTNVAMADALKTLEIVEGIEDLQQEAAASVPETPQKIDVRSPDLPKSCRRTSNRSRRASKENESKEDFPEEDSAVPLPRTRRGTAAKASAARSRICKEEVEENESKENLPEEDSAVPLRRTRRGTASKASAARSRICKEEVEEKEVSSDLPEILGTPATCIGRKRATGASGRRKIEMRAEDENSNSSSTVLRSYSTRRSSRVSEKKLQEAAPSIRKSRGKTEISALLTKECEKSEMEIEVPDSSKDEQDSTLNKEQSISNECIAEECNSSEIRECNSSEIRADEQDSSVDKHQSMSNECITKEQISSKIREDEQDSETDKDQPMSNICTTEEHNSSALIIDEQELPKLNDCIDEKRDPDEQGECIGDNYDLDQKLILLSDSEPLADQELLNINNCIGKKCDSDSSEESCGIDPKSAVIKPDEDQGEVLNYSNSLLVENQVSPDCEAPIESVASKVTGEEKVTETSLLQSEKWVLGQETEAIETPLPISGTFKSESGQDCDLKMEHPDISSSFKKSSLGCEDLAEKDTSTEFSSETPTRSEASEVTGEEKVDISSSFKKSSLGCEDLVENDTSTEFSSETTIESETSEVTGEEKVAEFSLFIQDCFVASATSPINKMPPTATATTTTIGLDCGGESPIVSAAATTGGFSTKNRVLTRTPESLRCNKVNLSGSGQGSKSVGVLELGSDKRKLRLSSNKKGTTTPIKSKIFEDVDKENTGGEVRKGEIKEFGALRDTENVMANKVAGKEPQNKAYIEISMRQLKKMIKEKTSEINKNEMELEKRTALHALNENCMSVKREN